MKASLLAAATIGKTHGLDGYLRLYPLSGEIEHLMKLEEAVIRLRDGSEKKVIAESIRLVSGDALIRFRGYDTPEKARVLAGGVLFIERSLAPELGEGEFYVADFYGLDVISDGVRAGTIEDTSEGAQAIMLHIRCNDGRIRLVPYLPVFLSHPDFDKGTIELLMPELLS